MTTEELIVKLKKIRCNTPEESTARRLLTELIKEFPREGRAPPVEIVV